MRLKDKVAIVTGGAQGIGAEIVRRFADEGANVVIGDRNQAEGLKTADTIWKESGQMIYFHQLDVTDTKSIAALVERTRIWFGRIDILVNNAGITRDATLLKMTDEDFDAVINVNLRGVFRMTRAVAPHMVAQGSGVILNASSVVSGGNFGQTNYVASKAGIEGMTVTWARELGKKGIRVNAVAPGFTDTPMTSPLSPEVKAKVVAATLLGRFATAEEVADVYCFLACNTFMTGQVVRVDGGFIN